MVEIAVERGLSRPKLWAAIRDAKLPGVVVPGWRARPNYFTFTDQLQKMHNLTDKSVLRLVAEYRRYLYLKAVDDGPLAPSTWVDRAWRQHLATDGGNAWDRFCRDVLNCRPEHRTGLSSDETQTSYARTLDLYRMEFNEEPPKDIWPGDAERRRRALGNWIGRFGLVGFLLGFILIFLGAFVGWEAASAIAFIVCLFPGAILMIVGWGRNTWAPDLEKTPGDNYV